MSDPLIPSEVLLHPHPQRIEVRPGTVDVSVLDEPRISVDPEDVAQSQGYRLSIGPDGAEINGHDDAGVFYGRQTLAQWRTGHGEQAPCVQIEDWPDLLVRGYMLDISRDRVPTMATIRHVIGVIARLKFNQLQIYTEHTVAYEGHEPVWKDASPLSFDELAEIERYCNERFIDLAPCQNVFGHMHRWLMTPGYEHLAEAPDGWDTPWGWRDHRPSSLYPADPASFDLSADLIDQLAAHSNSALFNIGCDETNDLGQGKSKERVERDGRAAVYLEYLQRLCGRVADHGKTPMFWGDIVLDHPELIAQLPDDAVLLNWGYEADHPFMEQSKRFEDAGVRFYVCPGTSGWCTLTGRGQNAVDNIRAAAEAGIKHGAEGLLVTDWGDNGHWQPLPISWVGVVYAAGAAWALKPNEDTTHLPQHISRIALGEPTDTLGQMLWELSNLYRACDARLPNTTWWFHALEWFREPWDAEPRRRVDAQGVADTVAELDRLDAALAAYTPGNEASALVQREIAWCLALVRWVCDHSPYRAGPDAPPNLDGIEADYRALWRQRCRPGGLDDSVEKLTRVLRPPAST